MLPTVHDDLPGPPLADVDVVSESTLREVLVETEVKSEPIDVDALPDAVIQLLNEKV